MPRKVLVVGEYDRMASRTAGDESCWTLVAWSSFSRQLLDSIPADLLVVVGPAERLTRADLLDWRKDSPRCRMLAVLPPESATEDIERVLGIADDLILSSERQDLFELRVQRLLDAGSSDAQAAYEGLIAELGRVNLVGMDPNFLRATERLAASARTDLPVLITGETGTGKELFARAIHFMSHRRNHPFIPVDCGGIPDQLFENELFGHVRGAFTDAHGEQRGLAAAAEGGTLFLDEVDSLSPAAQAKLLRFLQERQFRALGSEKWTHADARILAASNRDLARQTAEKQFRQDLYFRLDVLRLEVPSLRERPRDIALLARHFLSQYQPPGTHKSLAPAALQRLESHDWPGNVRELLNVIQRAIVFSHGSRIEGSDIALSKEVVQPRRQDFRTAREETLESFERAYIEELLRRHQGNITHAALDAGKERRAFGRLVKKYGFRARARAAGQI
jgi:DNA-binding NtrC family response regulator